MKTQNQILSLIGKPGSLKRSQFKIKLKRENKHTKSKYNLLLRTLNSKNKEFEQDYFNNFLEEENLKAKQNKVFDIDKCKKIIKKRPSAKTEQRFESLVTEIDGASIPIEHRIPQSKIASKLNPIKIYLSNITCVYNENYWCERYG